MNTSQKAALPADGQSSVLPDGDDFRVLLASFVQAIWETDATGQVHIDSPSWRTYSGQSRQQWLAEG